MKRNEYIAFLLPRVFGSEDDTADSLSNLHFVVSEMAEAIAELSSRLEKLEAPAPQRTENDPCEP